MAASSGLMLALGLTLPVAKAASDAGLLQEALQRADQTESEVIAWRRHIHQHPELSYQETETAKYIADALRAMPGITVETGIARTGVKAVLKGGKPGPVVALRADMDALPVQERNDLPFRSQAKAVWRGEQVSVSHACGHDTHVAMLLGAAKALSAMQDELPGTIVFLFQPAEEWGPDKEPSGARARECWRIPKWTWSSASTSAPAPPPAPSPIAPALPWPAATASRYHCTARADTADAHGPRIPRSYPRQN
jgi:amidohydrolase